MDVAAAYELLLVAFAVLMRSLDRVVKCRQRASLGLLAELGERALDVACRCAGFGRLQVLMGSFGIRNLDFFCLFVLGLSVSSDKFCLIYV